jgi:thiamine transporter
MLQGLYVVHWIQFFLDYLLAFGVLCTAGMFRKNLILGIVLACALRFLCSYVSGFVFFAEYAPAGQSPLLYSLLYNGTYMLPDTLICIAVTLIPGMRKSIEALKAKALAVKQEPAVS